ncbi:MAG: ice-binding family protein [Nanoarchaeota archaeon]
MKQNKTSMNIFASLFIFALLAVSVSAGYPELPVDLGTAENFAILAKSGISTTGTTAITGNIGVSPIDSTAITGFGLIMHSSNTYATSSLVTGNVYAADYTAPTPTIMTTAIGDMETAYANALGRSLPTTTELGAGNIGGLIIAPGLHKWGTGVIIPADVTFSGSSTDIWILQVAGTLDISSDTDILLAGGALAKNIFWQVTDATTIGTGATFNGNIIDLKEIVVRTGATLNGHALSQTAVTLDGNAVTSPTGVVTLNYAPVYVGPIANVTMSEDTTNTVLNISTAFTDVDTADLDWTVTAPANWTVTINDTSGIVTIIPMANFFGIGNLTFFATDRIFTSNASDTIFVTVTTVTDVPNFSPAVADQTATVGTDFSYTLPGFHGDGAALTYNDNNTEFDINNATGLINFNPTAEGVIYASINACDAIVCTESNFTITVAPRPDSHSSSGGSSGGSGGGSSSETANNGGSSVTVNCAEWSAWSTCFSDATRTRNCESPDNAVPSTDISSCVPAQTPASQVAFTPEPTVQDSTEFTSGNQITGQATSPIGNKTAWWIVALIIAGIVGIGLSGYYYLKK